MLEKLRIISRGAVISGMILLSGCSSESWDFLSPFSHSEVEVANKGERTNKAILEESGGSGVSAEDARKALEVMGKYQETHDAKPYAPVLKPAEVRLMWVPDHLNRNGDLVPAHYYFLKVLPDIWMTQDAFEIEEQITSGRSGAGSAVPWVYGKPIKARGKSKSQ